MTELPGRLTLLSIILIWVLSACATVNDESNARSDTSEKSSSERTSTEKAASEPLPVPVKIEYGNFSEGILARVIIAEMAVQRGYNLKAMNDYMALARETNDLNIIKRASRIASFLRNVSAVIEMGNMWLAKEPESQEALRTLSFQMVSMGRYRETMDHLTKLLALGATIDFRLISNQTANDNNAALVLDALIADFEDLKALYPDNQSLRLGLAHLYQQNDQEEQAYALVSVLAEEMNNSTEVIILEVELLEQMGERELAKRRLQKSLRNNENNKELRFQYARKLIDDQRYREAHDQFEIIVEQFPNDFDMLYSLALISMEINMLNDAKQYFRRLVDNSQRLNNSHYYLGFINVQENNTDQAIEHFINVGGGGNFLQAQHSLTELMVRTGRYREVKSRLQNIRFRNPDYNIPLITMEANVLMDEGFQDEASVVLNNSIGAFPNNIQLLFLRSVHSQEINDLSLMEEDLRKIILLNPNNPVAYNSLGYFLADRTDRYEEAYELIQRAIELTPDDPAIIDSLGWVQYRLGLYNEAKQNLDRAYELFPDHEVAAHLGEVLWIMGEKSAAKTLWRKALDTQPDSEYIRSTMERLTSDSSI